MASSIRVIQPPRTVDPYYHNAERLAEIEARISLLERGPLTTFVEIGAGSPNPAFQTGYANYSPSNWAKAGYWVIGNRVFLQGTVFSNLAAGNGPIWTMPAGLWPSRYHMFGMYGQTGAARVDVTSVGQVYNQSAAGFAAGAVAASSWYLTLAGISYPIGN